MRNLLSLIATVVIMVALLASGCAKSTPATAPKTLDIGIATPLTGPAAYLGTHMRNAILLAIDDQNKGILMAKAGQNKEGGVTIVGQKYMLNGIVLDTKLDVVVSKSVAEQLIFDKGVKVIAGPFLFDAIGAQTVTEPNEVILFALVPSLPGLASPNKPYTFFCAGGPQELTVTGAAYIQKFYPELKTVASMNPDLPSLPAWVSSAEVIFPRYGLKWLGLEKFPFDAKDFSPVISRVLAKKPDIVDTAGTAGDMGALCALLIKQIREAGFNGVIMARTSPPIPVMMEVVPEQYRTKIVTSDILVDSPVVSQTYKDMYQRYADKFGEPPIDVVGEVYNAVKAFFEFLDGQDTMDTTAWMEGFAKYHWQGIWGTESFWVGKPLFGVDRVTIWGFWTSEYIDGKPETRWAAPIIWDLWVEQK